MPDRIDHAQLARVGMRMTDGEPMSVQTLMLAEAQVNATLALVEQQRVANLIALENQRWQRVGERGNYWGPDVLRGNPDAPDGNADLYPWIKEALGL